MRVTGRNLVRRIGARNRTSPGKRCSGGRATLRYRPTWPRLRSRRRWRTAMWSTTAARAWCARWSPFLPTPTAPSATRTWSRGADSVQGSDLELVTALTPKMTPMLRYLALSFSFVACGKSSPSPESTPTQTQTAPPSTPAPDGGPACEDGMTIWDPTANDCRLFPGGPYGKTGCSQHLTDVPAGYRCFTGSHWDRHCDCECDNGRTWIEELRRCEKMVKVAR